MWAFTLTKQLPRSKILNEYHSLVCDESQNSITVSGNVNITMRARSSGERNRWVEDLKDRAMNKADDDVIAMAEMIICDELVHIDDEKIIAFVSAVGPLPQSQIFDVVKNKYPIKNYREYYKELDLFSA